jgi:type IV pilus assembly protein PilP
MIASLTVRKGLLLAVTVVGLAACGGDMDDLDSYINGVKARPGGRIEPLPEITPYEVFTYIADAEGVRSPFVPDTPQAAGQAAGGTSPDPDPNGGDARYQRNGLRPGADL